MGLAAGPVFEFSIVLLVVLREDDFWEAYFCLPYPRSLLGFFLKRVFFLSSRFEKRLGCCWTLA